MWLIEVNVNPALFTNCAALQCAACWARSIGRPHPHRARSRGGRAVIPGVVSTTLDVVLALHEQRGRGVARPVLPADLGGFTAIVVE